jgi:hypothetical protein
MLFLLFLLSSFVSASSFGYNSGTNVIIQNKPIYQNITQFNVTFNETQFETNNPITLNLTWLSDFFSNIISSIGNWTADKVNYYNTTESNNNYVNINGDSMTGNLSIAKNSISSGYSLDVNGSTLSTSILGTGVYGVSTNGSGVRGLSTNSYGVIGTSTTNNGVYGISTSSSGVRGTSTDSYGAYGSSTNNIGVRGTSSIDSGVYGYSVTGSGVYGVSGNGSGVRGASTYSYSGYFARNSETTIGNVPVFFILQDHSSNNYSAIDIRQDGNGAILRALDDTTEVFRINDGGNIGLKTSTPTYPLTINDNVSDISIYAQAQISATGFITRTSVYDKSKGSVFDFIKDTNDYKIKDKDGKDKIDHSKFYGYVQNITTTDYSRPVENKSCLDDECVKISYPYTKTEEGVSLDEEINVLRQAVYELNERVKILEKECLK